MNEHHWTDGYNDRAWKVPAETAHFEVARSLEAKGYYVTEDSENNEHSYIWEDKENNILVGHIWGDCEARVEWEIE